MVVDADPRLVDGESGAVGHETPPAGAAESDASDVPAEAVWGQRSLSVGSGCLFFLGGCVLCCGLLMVLLLTSGTDPEVAKTTEDGPPAPRQPGSGPREGGLSYGGPTLKTLHEIALDELGRLDGKGRQNEAGEYVEVELRGGVYDNDLKQVARLKSLQCATSCKQAYN